MRGNGIVYTKTPLRHGSCSGVIECRVKCGSFRLGLERSRPRVTMRRRSNGRERTDGWIGHFLGFPPIFGFGGTRNATIYVDTGGQACLVTLGGEIVPSGMGGWLEWGNVCLPTSEVGRSYR
jgi:hypothetical protein